MPKKPLCMVFGHLATPIQTNFRMIIGPTLLLSFQVTHKLFQNQLIIEIKFTKKMTVNWFWKFSMNIRLFCKFCFCSPIHGVPVTQHCYGKIDQTMSKCVKQILVLLKWGCKHWCILIKFPYVCPNINKSNGIGSYRIFQ